jgi:hypothetical protein
LQDEGKALRLNTCGIGLPLLLLHVLAALSVVCGWCPVLSG